MHTTNLYRLNLNGSYIKNKKCAGDKVTTTEQLKKIVSILDSKKGIDIKVIEIGDLSILGDYFVIASGASSTQTKALAGEVEFQLSREGIEPKHAEGMRSENWILLDYGDIIVHIFYAQTREFYDLERLWADGNALDIETLL